VTCTVCGQPLAEGEWAACRVEQRCLTDCSDYWGHCGTAEMYDEINGVPDEDSYYERAVDSALEEAHQQDDMENWRAYLPKGGA
jgi:hypothetical protein